jgi:hypothetical protein
MCKPMESLLTPLWVSRNPFGKRVDSYYIFHIFGLLMLDISTFPRIILPEVFDQVVTGFINRVTKIAVM